MDRENEANMMFIIYMASCLGEWKQVQEKRFDSHLAGVSK